MSEMNSSALAQAYELIEAGNPQQARVLLEPILRDTPQNVDAWWVYAHAVDDPELARDALNRVLSVDADYPGAHELMSVLEAQYPRQVAGASAPSIRPISPLPARDVTALDESPTYEEDTSVSPQDTVERAPVSAASASTVRTYDATRSTREVAPVGNSTSRRGFPYWILAAALIAIGLIVVVVLANRPTDTLTLEATGVAINATEAPTFDPQGVAPIEVSASPLPSVAETSAATLVVGVATEIVEPTAILLLDETAEFGAGATSEVATTDAVGTEVVPNVLPFPGADVTAESTTAGEDVAGISDVSTDVANAATAATAANAATDAPDTTPEATTIPRATAISAADVTAETLLPTPTQEAFDVQAASTAESTDDQGGGAADATLEERLSSLLQLSPEPFSTEATPLGETLVVSVCTTPERLRTDLTNALNTLARQSALYPAELEAVGVQMVNCAQGATETPLRRVGVSAQNARDYTAGTLSDAGFQGLWRAF